MSERPFPKIEISTEQRNNMLAWLRRESQTGNHHALIALAMFFQMAEFVRSKIEIEGSKSLSSGFSDATNQD